MSKRGKRKRYGVCDGTVPCGSSKFDGLAVLRKSSLSNPINQSINGSPFDGSKSYNSINQSIVLPIELSIYFFCVFAFSDEDTWEPLSEMWHLDLVRQYVDGKLEAAEKTGNVDRESGLCSDRTADSASDSEFSCLRYHSFQQTVERHWPWAWKRFVRLLITEKMLHCVGLIACSIAECVVLISDSIDWLIDCLFGWLFGWLIDWLIAGIVDQCVLTDSWKKQFKMGLGLIERTESHHFFSLVFSTRRGGSKTAHWEEAGA